MLRELEASFGSTVSAWELPLALFRARGFMDQVEDYWERGPGRSAPDVSAYNHALAVYGWDLRDALSKTAATCEEALHGDRADFTEQPPAHPKCRGSTKVGITSREAR